MNIGRISQVMETYQANNKRQVSQSRGKTGADEVQLSNEAKFYELAKKAAAQIPDVREDRVAAIAKKLEHGKYSVSAAAVAQKVMEGWLF